MNLVDYLWQTGMVVKTGNLPKPGKCTKTCIIHCTNSREPEKKPESLESWKKLVVAATGLQLTGILEKAKNLPEDEFGKVFYHHWYRI